LDNYDIWHVSMSQGNINSVVSIQLTRTITHMTADGVVPEVLPGGEDWTHGPGCIPYVSHPHQDDDRPQSNTHVPL